MIFRLLASILISPHSSGSALNRVGEPLVLKRSVGGSANLPHFDSFSLRLTRIDRLLRPLEALSCVAPIPSWLIVSLAIFNSIADRKSYSVLGLSSWICNLNHLTEHYPRHFRIFSVQNLPLPLFLPSQTTPRARRNYTSATVETFLQHRLYHKHPVEILQSKPRRQ